jgi:undecaprenyl diphosphate synthase
MTTVMHAFVLSTGDWCERDPVMPSSGTNRLHVGCIMDGNGRWASARNMPRLAGHQAGVETLRRIVRAAPDNGVDVLTVYAFSADNWRRPPAEVEDLISLLRSYLDIETEKLVRDGVRLTVFGRRDRLPDALVTEIERSEAATQWGDALHLRVAIDYSSREAILSAAMAATNLPVLTQELFGKLVTGGVDQIDVDLLIRTSGEQRLSDFLLWESAYAELYFTKCLWPDFTEAAFIEALTEFRQRERRFGGLSIRAA